MSLHSVIAPSPAKEEKAVRASSSGRATASYGAGGEGELTDVAACEFLPYWPNYIVAYCLADDPQMLLRQRVLEHQRVHRREDVSRRPWRECAEERRLAV